MDTEKRFAQYLIAAVSFIIGVAAIAGCLVANTFLPIFKFALVTPSITPNPWAAGELSIVGDFVLIQPFTIKGNRFKPEDSIDIFLSSSENAPIERWTLIGEALGDNRVKADGTFVLNNLRIPTNLSPPYFIRARASSDKRLTCAVLQIDKSLVTGGMTARSCGSGITPPAPVTLLPPLITAPPVPIQETPTFTPLALVTTTPIPPTNTPAPLTPVPTNATSYWFGRFYANKDLTGNVVFEAAPVKDLAFSWGEGSPSPNVPVDNFSAIWERTEIFPDADQYEFMIKVDDGVRLFFDNKLISSPIEFRSGPLRTILISQFVTAGPHPIRVEYMEEQFNATIEVTWRKVNAAPGTFQGKYYNNLQHTGNVIYKSLDPQIDMDWSLALPPPGVAFDGFSVKWDSTLNITRTGRYVFNIIADSGVAILINNANIINELNNSGGTIERAIEVPINALGSYNMQVFYVNRSGRGRIKIDWQLIPPPVTPTPTPSLTPLPSNTPAPTTTSIPSATPRNTATPTFTPTATRTPTSLPPSTPTVTPTRALAGGSSIIDLLRPPKTSTPTRTPNP